MIENELKYVLGLSTDVTKFFGKKKKIQIREISQGYLSSQARIRSLVEDKVKTFKFTYKIALPTKELEEFEMDIDEASFDRVFAIATNKLQKHRYTWEEDGATWDLDFFYNDQGLYFCMAECEMPSGWVAPRSLPTIIHDNLLFAVPRERSSEFSSKKISDFDYAQRLLTEISPQDLVT